MGPANKVSLPIPTLRCVLSQRTRNPLGALTPSVPITTWTSIEHVMLRRHCTVERKLVAMVLTPVQNNGQWFMNGLTQDQRDPFPMGRRIFRPGNGPHFVGLDDSFAE